MSQPNMKLLRFRVTDFRSVKDSKWIETNNVTALIGTNESGKTNLLLPLWKLKPAKDGEIDALSDYPRNQYHIFRDMEIKPVFIRAQFKLSDELATQIAEMASWELSDIQVVEVSRNFDKNYEVSFPEAHLKRELETAIATNLLTGTSTALQETEALKTEQSHYSEMLSTIKSILDNPKLAEKFIDEEGLEQICLDLNSVSLGDMPKTSKIKPLYESLLTEFTTLQSSINQPHPNDNEEVYSVILEAMPSFVYYPNFAQKLRVSNYYAHRTLKTEIIYSINHYKELCYVYSD